MPKYEWWVYVVLALPGVFFFVMNWGIVINNMSGKRFVSNVPGVGGIWIAIVCLLSPLKWLALIGLADPGIWLFIQALIKERIPTKKEEISEEGLKQMENTNAMDPKEVKKAKRKKRGKIAAGICLSICAAVLILCAIFHTYIYDITRTAICEWRTLNGYKTIEYKEVSLSKEQMLEDMDFLFDATVNESLSKDLAEQYYDVDYDEIYETYRERVLNCEDEFEFNALMISLGAKLPGGHTGVYSATDNLGSSFPMGEMTDKKTYEVNYALCKQYEDRMGEFTQKYVIASYLDGDYILRTTTLTDFEAMDEVVDTRLVSLNGKPVKDVLKDLDTLYHWKYDASTDSVMVTTIIFNDGVGEKYEAELERPDGTTFKQDFYVSAEYNMAFYYRSRLYPDRFKKAEESTEATEESTEGEEEKSYSFFVDKDKKLLYANFTECDGTEEDQLREDLKQLLATEDIDNIILDFRSNSGGSYSYVTKGLLPVVLDHDAGHYNGALYPRNEYTKNFADNKFYRIIRHTKDSGDYARIEENFTIKGEAEKSYKIYALVGHRTFSSGDIFAYLAKEAGITLIGQNTGGEGLAGSPLQTYMPNSRIQFTFVSSESEIYPEDSYLGVVPDYTVANDWESFKGVLEEYPNLDDEAYTLYENRLKWDPVLQKAIELIEE